MPYSTVFPKLVPRCYYETCSIIGSVIVYYVYLGCGQLDRVTDRAHEFYDEAPRLAAYTKRGVPALLSQIGAEEVQPFSDAVSNTTMYIFKTYLIFPL